MCEPQQHHHNSVPPNLREYGVELMELMMEKAMRAGQRPSAQPNAAHHSNPQLPCEDAAPPSPFDVTSMRSRTRELHRIRDQELSARVTHGSPSEHSYSYGGAPTAAASVATADYSPTSPRPRNMVRADAHSLQRPWTPPQDRTSATPLGQLGNEQQVVMPLQVAKALLSSQQLQGVPQQHRQGVLASPSASPSPGHGRGYESLHCNSAPVSPESAVPAPGASTPPPAPVMGGMLTDAYSTYRHQGGGHNDAGAAARGLSPDILSAVSLPSPQVCRSLSVSETGGSPYKPSDTQTSPRAVSPYDVLQTQPIGAAEAMRQAREVCTKTLAQMKTHVRLPIFRSSTPTVRFPQPPPTPIGPPITPTITRDASSHHRPVRLLFSLSLVHPRLEKCLLLRCCILYLLTRPILHSTKQAVFLAALFRSGTDSVGALTCTVPPTPPPPLHSFRCQRSLGRMQAEMAQPRDAAVDGDARKKARVMVEHYIAAQQMNTFLQKQVVELRELLRVSEQTREEELQAVARKVQQADREISQLRERGGGAAATPHSSQLEARVRELETENARLREMSFAADSGPAMRAQNEALKAKLIEKKSTIASLVWSCAVPSSATQHPPLTRHRNKCCTCSCRCVSSKSCPLLSLLSLCTLSVDLVTLQDPSLPSALPFKWTT